MSLRIPYIFYHRRGLPDLDSLFHYLKNYSEIYEKQGVKFTYELLIGVGEVKLLFIIEKK